MVYWKMFLPHHKLLQLKFISTGSKTLCQHYLISMISNNNVNNMQKCCLNNNFKQYFEIFQALSASKNYINMCNQTCHSFRVCKRNQTIMTGY